MVPLEVGLSASASSGNALRLGNYSVVGGGGMSKQQVVLYIVIAAVALAAFTIYMRKK